MSTPATPQQFFAQLLAELSASGDAPINASTAFGTLPNVTARGAWTNTYWKLTALLNMLDRPRSPGAADDLYGHVLNMRAEGLQNQALLTALCEAAKINVTEVLAGVTTTLNVQPPATASEAQ